MSENRDGRSLGEKLGDDFNQNIRNFIVKSEAFVDHCNAYIERLCLINEDDKRGDIPDKNIVREIIVSHRDFLTGATKLLVDYGDEISRGSKMLKNTSDFFSKEGSKDEESD